jgi:GNAT superfamily N-acetyltransferase
MPVSARSSRSDVSAEFVQRAWRLDMMNLALGHRTFEADGATFVVNPSLPSIYDANFLYDVTASSDAEIDRLLERARREYAHCSKLTFRIAPWSPPSLEARLALIGVEQSRTLVLLLTGELRGTPRAQDLRPIDDDEGWRAFRELKRAEVGEGSKSAADDPHRWDVPDGLAAAARLKCPPVRYTLAYADGRPVGYFNSWAGVDGLGQVEDLFVLPSYRHRGIATALIHHCVAEARRNGAGPIVICASAADTPKAMYAAMGWEPIAVGRQYVIDREPREQ